MPFWGGDQPPPAPEKKIEADAVESNPNVDSPASASGASPSADVEAAEGVASTPAADVANADLTARRRSEREMIEAKKREQFSASMREIQAAGGPPERNLNRNGPRTSRSSNDAGRGRKSATFAHPTSGAEQQRTSGVSMESTPKKGLAKLRERMSRGPLAPRDGLGGASATGTPGGGLLSRFALGSKNARDDKNNSLPPGINPSELRPSDVFVQCEFKSLSEAVSDWNQLASGMFLPSEFTDAPSARAREKSAFVASRAQSNGGKSEPGNNSIEQELAPGQSSCCWYGGRGTGDMNQEAHLEAKRAEAERRRRAKELKRAGTGRVLGSRGSSMMQRIFGGDMTQGEDDADEVLVYQGHAGLRDKLNRIRNLSTPAGTIHPNSIFRKCWDFVQLIVLLYICVVIPIRVGFEKPAYGAAFIIDLLVDIFFVLDIIFNFYTGYFDSNGDIELRAKMLRVYYLKTWFIIDTLAALPVDYFIRAAEGELSCSFTTCLSAVENAAVSFETSSQGRLFRLIRILRMTKLFKLLRVARMRILLEKYSGSVFLLQPVLSIGKQVGMLIFLGHMLGCFYYYFSLDTWWTSSEVVLISEGLITPWIETQFYGQADRLPATVLASGGYACAPGYQLQDIGVGIECGTMFNIGIRYVSSLYWSFATMTTVGYGDIAARTLSERVYSIFALILGGFVFSGIIGRMGAILSQLDATKNAATRHLDTVNGFLRDIKLPPELRGPVLGFFRKQRVRPYQTREVLTQLPFDLRCRVVKYMYEDDIRLTPIMGMRDDDLFITDICMRLNAYSISSFSYVYKRGETSSDVYILLHGELAIIDVDLDTIVCKVTRGGMFGLSSVLDVVGAHDFRPKRRENVYSLSGCQLLRITLEDFLEIIVTYPDILPHLIAFHEEFERLTETHRSRAMNLVSDLLRGAGSDGSDGPSPKGGEGALPTKSSRSQARSTRGKVSLREMEEASRRAAKAQARTGRAAPGADMRVARNVDSFTSSRVVTTLLANSKGSDIVQNARAKSAIETDDEGGIADRASSHDGASSSDVSDARGLGVAPPPVIAALLDQMPMRERILARNYSDRAAKSRRRSQGLTQGSMMGDVAVIPPNGGESDPTYPADTGPRIQGGMGFSALAVPSAKRRSSRGDGELG